MVKVAVLVSGGGTNLQAILDAKAAGKLPHAELALVVASKPGVYALQRAAGASGAPEWTKAAASVGAIVPTVRAAIAAKAYL